MMRAVDPEALSSSLTWQEFECLAEDAFKSLGFSTAKNFRIKSPRTEIDLLARQLKTVFAVDCKHWKRTVGYATMNRVADRQVERCKRYLKISDDVLAIPVILTWHDENLRILKSGVPIVPINKISDFVLNWESASQSIRRVERKRRKKAQRQAILFS
jgi:Holliday junction resolvase-like predicted endonuclease